MRKRRDELPGPIAKFNPISPHGTESKLELVGTQTKLLAPAQAKLLTPSLSQSRLQILPDPMAPFFVKDKAVSQRAKVVMTEARKRGPKSGEAGVRKSVVVNLPNTAPSSAAQSSTKSTYHSPLGSSDLDSGVDLHALSASQFSPPQLIDDSNHDESLAVELDEFDGRMPPLNNNKGCAAALRSIKSELPLLHLTTTDSVSKSQFNESHVQRSQSSHTTNLTPASGDSGVSSGSELDHLLAKLGELLQQLHVCESPEPELNLSTTNRSSELPSPRSTPNETCEMTVPDEQEAISLLDRVYGAIYCLLHTLQQLDTPLPDIKKRITWDSDPLLENLDALLFLTGTMKFLAASPVVSEHLHNHSAFLVGLLSLHKQVDQRIRLWCTEATTPPQSGNGQEYLIDRLYLVLVQISDIFCNLTGTLGIRAKLLSTGGILDHVVDCLLCRMTPSNPEIVCARSSAQYLAQFNWIRFLARLTEYTETCLRLDQWVVDKLGQSAESLISSCTNYLHTEKSSLQSENKGTSRILLLCNLFFQMIQSNTEDVDLTVRIAYLLGNLTARLDSAREALFPNPLALADMCGLCRDYHRMILKEAKDNDVNNITYRDAWSDLTVPFSTVSTSIFEHQSCLEMVNKLVRILANSAIGETVGQLAVVSTDCLDLFLDLIECECPREPTELLVNCLAGLNNITYYIHSESTPAVLAKQYDVAEILIRTLAGGTAHPEVMLGVIRVFGNLTRQPRVRTWISQQAGQLLFDGSQTSGVIDPPTPWPSHVPKDRAMLYILIQNLDSSRPELVYSTLGVLINLMADVNERPAFKELGGISKLVEVLTDFAGHDWQLAGLACKALWNYTEAPNISVRKLIDAQTLNEVHNLLTEFTDEGAVDCMHQNIQMENSNVDEESTALWKAAWCSEFLPVANEFLARITQC
ncbi:unnamed protein product [Echinostoma caproni]|uniref:WAPL domain-containing protein n=1 Tax=Echinostoma caproni TaxID=27848 RepID=A0A183A9L8_9TREM|nr:unnamed protein product [Echinostoma caproni]